MIGFIVIQLLLSLLLGTVGAFVAPISQRFSPRSSMQMLDIIETVDNF
jgi:hypothetical protein